MPHPLQDLFDPRGIAVVGASSDTARLSGQTLPALVKFGYRGRIYAINPKYSELHGHKCYPSLAAVDGDCDVAVVVLPASLVPDVIEQCGKRGIRYAVVLSGGFRETGDSGADIERRMVANAKAHGVRIIGPNCVGLINVHAGAVSAFGTLTRPPVLQPGGVSAVVQSGGFGLSVVVRCALAGVGFRYVVASGNEADITTSELISAYVDDPETKVILAYIEGMSNGRDFVSAAQRALSAGKPIIVIKSGNTEEGRRAAASHTANMTGSYEIYQALFRQYGVIEALDIGQAADFVSCLTSGRLPRGRNVAIMGGSGGSAAVFSDAASMVGLKLPLLTEQTMAVLKQAFPAIGSYQNPVDYTAGYPRTSEGPSYQKAVEAVLADPGVDQLAFMFTTLEGNRMKHAAELISRAARMSDKPVMVFTVMPDEIVAEGRAIFHNSGIPVVESPKRIAAAMAMLATYGEALLKNRLAVASTPRPAASVPDHRGRDGSLNEHEAKRFLKEADIPVTDDVLLPVEAAGKLPPMQYPIVLKIVSADILHKTEIGAVRLDIRDEKDLREAWRAVVANARQKAPSARLQGVLASQMVSDGLETIVGVINDPGFGPVVMFGLGGIYAEILRDITYRVAPFATDEAHAMIGELKSRSILFGARGQAPRDVDAVAAVLVRVSEIAWAMRDRLVELEINPLLVRPAGKGVLAADALLTLS